MIFTTVFAAFALSGCGTYQLTNQSLLEQFAAARTEKKVNIFLFPPYLFFPGIVKGNNLRSVTCVDAKGNNKVIRVGRRTGVKIIKNDGKQVSFYFDTLILKDSTISGSKTHFFNAPIKPVLLSEIKKIEIMQ